MHDINFILSEIIGGIGVSLLLIAFLFNLRGVLEGNSITYILLNLVGAVLSCIASAIIKYVPFVILEGAWALVSLIALINRLKK